MEKEKKTEAKDGAILLKAPAMVKPSEKTQKPIRTPSNQGRVDTSNFLEFDYFDKKK